MSDELRATRSFGGRASAVSSMVLATASAPRPRTACRRRSRGCWCAGAGRRRRRRRPTLPRMITPVGHRSTHRAQRVQTSSSIMKITWSAGSAPGLLGVDRLGDRVRRDHVDALPRADVDAALAHDALGLVDVDELLRLDRLGEVVGVDLDRAGSRRNSGIGGLASVRAMRSALPHQRPAVAWTWRARRRPAWLAPLLPPRPHEDLQRRGRSRRCRRRRCRGASGR